MDPRRPDPEPNRLTQLSPSLWWYRDTCNVYLWTFEDRGLLIDFGSGAILDELGVEVSAS